MGAYNRLGKLYHFLFVVIIISCAAGSAMGVVVGQTNTPTGDWDIDWGYVYNLNGSSSVAIDDYWVLTAAHVAEAGNCGLTIDSTTYTAQEIIYHGTADLALVRYDKALPGHYSLYNGSTTGMDAIMIGYGYTGEDHDSYYTWTTGTAGTKRWGTNKIDFDCTADYDKWSSEGFKMTFDSVASGNRTEFECGAAQRDSGGGTFVEVDGQWVLAGINTAVFGNGNPGEYTGTFAVSVPEYFAWINTTIPEPTTIGLLAIGSSLLLLRRWRRRSRSKR